MDNSKNIFDPDFSNLVGVTHIATSVTIAKLLTDTVYFTDPKKAKAVHWPNFYTAFKQPKHLVPPKLFHMVPVAFDFGFLIRSFILI